MSEQKIINAQARDKAIELVKNMSVSTTSLVEYQSRGKLVVIGGDEAMEFAPRLREKDLTVEVLLTGGGVEPGEIVIPLGNRKIEIEGYLGAYKIALGDKGKANFELLTPDLILDLSENSLLSAPLKPPGYFVADFNNEFSMLSVIDQLGDMVGTFEKPKYFDYDASICAHGRSGQIGCTACIDACPAQAIHSLIESIEVTPYLCQGGGVCASVCPTGAIRYAYPSAKNSGEQIRHLLQNYYQNAGELPIVAFISEDDYLLVEQWPENYLPVVVEELASIGLELWMSALAYGASSVVMVSAENNLEVVNKVMSEQLDLAQRILQGINISPAVLSTVMVEDIGKVNLIKMPQLSNAEFSGKDDKRRILFMAIDHLAKSMNVVQGEIVLTQASLFGAIEVNAEKCTLCMACTSVCPAKALHAGNEEPKLMFTELNCVQCGLCEHSCPEQAIELIPRYQLDAEQRRKSIVIKEDEPFLCISCGKAFATQSMISTVSAKLSVHAMFQSDRALNRLKMCDDCRVIDVMQDSEAMNLAQGGIGGVIGTSKQDVDNKGGQNDSQKH